MPRRKFDPWEVRPESAAVGVVGRAKAAIGILADDLKSVSELPMAHGGGQRIIMLHNIMYMYS